MEGILVIPMRVVQSNQPTPVTASKEGGTTVCGRGLADEGDNTPVGSVDGVFSFSCD